MLRTRDWVRWLSMVNQHALYSVIEAQGPVVSMTTFSDRTKTVHLAIESIARGRKRPSKMVLWLDDKHVFNHLPATLERLKARGLTIRLSKDYGPHKKYYPYVESQGTFDLPLVTADDDVLYPRFWLAGLLNSYREVPDVIHCYRAHVIEMNGSELAKYVDWKMCTTSKAGFRHIATGVSGILYPPSFLYILKNAGTAFETCCPKADDLWLHVHALRAGFKVRQVYGSDRLFPFIPGTQETALHLENVTSDGNDRQIQATYTKADIEMLAMAH
jgi:hypothetical protein